MRRNIALYINSQLADFESDSVIQFTYTMEDLTEPAIVKNSYSQQISLPSTPRNNKIFGHIANLDRRTTNGFNAMLRTPFVITEDGNLIESGYLKLDSVERKGAKLTYKVTLYGGLGSFFYSLSYAEDGQALSLADMDYLGGQRLDFRIYKTAVAEAWAELAKNGAYNKSNRWHTINFAPAYNGIPSADFDADKALCDPSIMVYPQSITEGEDTFHTNNFVELSKEYTEWETKDLRSYMQRPVMRMRSIIEACCDPQQNGGYAVNLDKSFFNDNNPYYNKTWISLPILRTLELSYDDGKTGATFSGVKTDADITTPTTMQVQYSRNVEGDQVSITLHIQQSITTNAGFSDGDTFFIGYESEEETTTGNPIYKPTSMRYTLRTRDINGNTTFQQSFDSPNTYKWAASQKKGIGEVCKVEFANAILVGAIEVKAEVVAENYDLNADRAPYVGLVGADQQPINAGYTITFSPASSEKNEIEYTAVTSARSGSMITQSALLATGHTPADYLLSYCKTFGLHFLHDKVTNQISIVTRNTLYGEKKIIDLNVKIDRSKPITITPYIFDTKWYDFKHTCEDGEFAEYYKTIYGYESGVHIVNTGFDFNSDHKDVLESVVFKGACQVKERSKYFNSLTTPDGEEVLEATDGILYDSESQLIYVIGGVRYYSSVLLDGSHKVHYVDWKGNSHERDISTIPFGADVEYFDPIHKSYDQFSKVQFHDKDNSDTELRDVLLFYDGQVGARVSLSDDTTQMLTLNEGVPCWMLTVPTKDMQIARFCRFTDTLSLDMGAPKEIDMPDAEYPTNGTIYANGWDAYIADRYDVDTKIVKCRVDLRGLQVSEALLRNFYLFDNALWVLNKINNYSMTSYGSTECEFVKVKDMDNYTNGQKY